MKKLILITTIALLAMPVVATHSSAGTVMKRACIKTDRGAKNPQACRCVQRVANQVLTRTDQRKASKFFKDPHRAQVVRQSDNPSNEAFWKRYKSFAQTVSASCS